MLNMVCRQVYLTHCTVSDDLGSFAWLPLFLRESISKISKDGSKTEGTLRLAGNETDIIDWKSMIDKGMSRNMKSCDVATASSLLKMFLKSMPEALIPSSAHDSFFDVIQASDGAQRCGVMRSAINSLPIENRAVLRYLLPTMRKIVDNGHVTKVCCTIRWCNCR